MDIQFLRAGRSITIPTTGELLNISMKESPVSGFASSAEVAALPALQVILRDSV